MKTSGLLDKYLYFKLSIDAIFGHVGFWLMLMEKVMVFGIFIKIFNITNYLAIGVVGLIGLISMFLFGHLLLKKGVIARQISLGNQFNPELQKLLGALKKDENML